MPARETVCVGCVCEPAHPTALTPPSMAVLCLGFRYSEPAKRAILCPRASLGVRDYSPCPRERERDTLYNDSRGGSLSQNLSIHIT